MRFLICKKIGLTPSSGTCQLTSDQILKLIKCIEKSNLKKSKIMLAKELTQIEAYKEIRKITYATKKEKKYFLVKNT